MDLELRIDRLVLDGLPLGPAQRPLLQQALEQELGRLLAEDGLPPALLAGGAWPRLAGGGVEWSADADPGSIGRGIARAVYGGMSG